MKKANFIISLVFVASMLFLQVGGVFAAPALQSSGPVIGVVQSIILETDSTTGVAVVNVDLIDNNQILQSVRVSQKTAIVLGLVILNGDGKPGINNLALGKQIEIDPADVIPAQEGNQHPVGNALATYFSDIPGVDYGSIMAAYEQGNGFGTIAQALWLTKKIQGNSTVFESLLQAKQTGDYSAFVLADGSTPENWGQLKKAILDADKNGDGNTALSNTNNNGTDDDKENNQQKDKDKEKNNNGNNGNDKEKDKDKNK